MTPTTDAQPKPRLALAIATGFGLGYLPKAPGTFGSLLGVLLTSAALSINAALESPSGRWDLRAVWSNPSLSPTRFVAIETGLVILLSLFGVWAADRVADYLQKKDPQIVVIDEVAGQLVTYLIPAYIGVGLGWKYLLVGFLLFRLFDIWKPFPIRRAESLPGGLGIMADDWLAGVYAALLLALAPYFGL
jgi:phosphatidylglycerophosphatase A